MEIHHFDVFYPLNDVVAEESDNCLSDGDSETNGQEPIHAHTKFDLNSVPQMLEEDLTSFKPTAEQENVSHILTEQETKEIDAN